LAALAFPISRLRSRTVVAVKQPRKILLCQAQVIARRLLDGSN
jgi:hypothetical protein